MAAACDALLKCATMTVGANALGWLGFDYELYGALTPSREFTYDGATVRVSRIYFEADYDNLTMGFDGNLGGSDYTLQLGNLSFSLSDPGTGNALTATTSDIDWTVGDTVTVKLFEGLGGATLSDDATLTSLDFSVTRGEESELVTLTPAFDSATTEYTAVVGHRFANAEMSNIVRSDIGASVVVTDEFESHDLDSTEDSVEDLQLAIGVNTITVTVTAADGNTTETYTLVVTRAAPPPPPAHCETGDILCATLTVEGLSAGGGEYGYGYSSDQGALSHIDFEHDGTQYTVTTLYENITPAALRISFVPSGETVFNTDDFFLYVDGTAFAFSDATFNSTYFEWADSGLLWSATDTVEVRLVDSTVDNTPPSPESAAGVG